MNEIKKIEKVLMKAADKIIKHIDTVAAKRASAVRANVSNICEKINSDYSSMISDFHSARLAEIQIAGEEYFMKLTAERTEEENEQDVLKLEQAIAELLQEIEKQEKTKKG